MKNRFLIFALAGIFFLPTFVVAEEENVQKEGTPAESKKESEELPKDVTLEPIKVEERYEQGYSIPNAATATKTDTPILETPVSLQAVPEAVITDQRANRLQETVENVSGVRFDTNDLEGYIYKLRGFTSYLLFRNGLEISSAVPGIQETTNLERVEVLKGPASILFGRVEPGGVINLVTRRPQASPFYKIEQEIGSYQHFRTIVDATGPLGTGAAYRFTGAFQDYESFRDFQGGQRTFAAPSVSFKLGAATDLLLDVQYLKNEAQSEIGTPALGEDPAPIPLSRSFQEPNDPRDRGETLHIGYELTHRFSDAWAVTNRFLYGNGDMWKLNVVGYNLDETTGVLDRATQHQTLDGETYSTNLDLTGKINAWGAHHDVLAGLDYLYDYYDYHYGEDSANYPINIFNPVYGTVPDSAYQDAVTGVSPTYVGFSSVLVKQTGLYLQDQIAWERWHVLVGGRYDWAVLDNGSSNTSAADAKAVRKAAPDKKDGEFSPRAGVLYELTPGLNVYASYARSFGANNGDDGSGNALPPEIGTQYELGTKAVLGNDVSATVAVYLLTKENIKQATGPTTFRAIGEAQSQGVEIDLQGRVTQRLSLITAYAYTDTETTQDNGGFQGNELDNAPHHTARVFAAYDFGAGGLGWRAGGGVYAASRAAANRENTAWLPAYARLDAFAGYTGRARGTRWTAQLNLRNLLNKEYYEGSDIYYNYISVDSKYYLLPGQPFTALATLRFEF